MTPANFAIAKQWLRPVIWDWCAGWSILRQEELLEQLATVLAAAVQAKAEAMIAELRAPYPEDIFSPMSRLEVLQSVAALRAAVGDAASDRMHAEWARYWAEMLLECAADVPEPPQRTP